MHSLPCAYVFRRIMLGVSALAVLLVLSVSNDRAIAAEAAKDNDFSQMEIYSQLKSGKRVWNEKAYMKPEQPTVYLTFDDGPSRLTGRVLDILREHNVTATFFVLGELVKARPELVRRAVEEGHAIGNHTYNHQYKELYSNVETFWMQIQRTEEALDDAAGIRPGLIRAPGGSYGNFDAFYFYYLDQAGYEVHDWNIDSGDSKRAGVPAAEILQTIKKGPFSDEVIVLLHDGAGHDQTAKALPDIIRFFKAQGYAFAPLAPQVQPVHFLAGKLKWSRSISMGLHLKLADEAGQHAQAMEEARVQKERSALERTGGQDEAAQQAAKEAQAGGPGGDRKRWTAAGLLEIGLGGGRLQIEPGQYWLSDGHFQVPLRRLIESMGGKAEWRESQRTAVIRYGNNNAEYDFSRNELRVYKGSSRITCHLPQMELLEGTVYVPLRATLELLGNRIVSFEMNEAGMKAEAVPMGTFVYSGYGF